MRKFPPFLLPLCFFAAGGLMLTAAQAAEPIHSTPMTSEQDHQNMMDELHITSLRPGADGFNPQEPNAQNTDEAKAARYFVLPNPPLFTRPAMPPTEKKRK